MKPGHPLCILIFLVITMTSIVFLRVIQTRLTDGCFTANLCHSDKGRDFTLVVEDGN